MSRVTSYRKEYKKNKNYDKNNNAIMHIHEFNKMFIFWLSASLVL